MAEPITTTGVKVLQALESAAKATPGAPVALTELDTGELSPETVRYLTQASGGPIGELWAIPGDWVRFRRWKRTIARVEEAQRILARRGREPRHVPDDVLVPLLEAASLTDVESLAAKWSTLLANATDPAADEVPRDFADVLRNLSPDDAQLLDHVVSSHKQASGRIETMPLDGVLLAAGARLVQTTASL